MGRAAPRGVLLLAAGDGGRVRWPADVYGRTEELDLGLETRGTANFREGGVYIGIEGARSVQMRCGFRPRDRDRTL